MTATQLAPVDNRETIKCSECLLTQFRGTKKRCCKCNAPFDPDEAKDSAPRPVVKLNLLPAKRFGDIFLSLSVICHIRRVELGLSQRQLAGRLGVARTFVSKFENNKTTPTLKSLQRMAKVLETTPYSLISQAEGLLLNEIAMIDGKIEPGLLDLIPQILGRSQPFLERLWQKTRDEIKAARFKHA